MNYFTPPDGLGRSVTPSTAMSRFLARQSTKQHRGAPFTSWRKVGRTALAPNWPGYNSIMPKSLLPDRTQSDLSVLRSIQKDGVRDSG